MPPRDVGSTSLLEALPRPIREVPTAVPPAFVLAIRSEPWSVEVARRVTRAWIRCHCRMPEHRVDAVLVVVSELCTNAVQHGQCGSMGVRGWMPACDEMRLEVHDGSPSAVPEPQYVGPESESGRGLLLVDLLITELGGTWGFNEDGTLAWCDLPLAPKEPMPAPLHANQAPTSEFSR
ncbi:ATP-binding protein [Streptomyces sp. NPDC007148]|uniref:ATP-binding protein n=1 Tax=Streptomyces sp. NPDC007148 TaxID=3364775 RepID=UPI0036754972